MKSEFIALEYDEYITVYTHYKHILNPFNTQIRANHMKWIHLGLEYYDSLPQMKRKFKVLNRKKWMQHLMLAKIK
jgi:hypothetical protein